jgi:hypothetical protein
MLLVHASSPCFLLKHPTNTRISAGSTSHTKSLLRDKPVIKFGNSHKTSTPQDQLKMLEYEVSRMKSLTQFHMRMNTNVLTTNMMNHNSGCLKKSHQVQKKLHHKQKALQYKVKTSSDADATQDSDLARVEGLHPREGITRHSALPVGPEFHCVLASSSNPTHFSNLSPHQ